MARQKSGSQMGRWTNGGQMVNHMVGSPEADRWSQGRRSLPEPGLYHRPQCPSGGLASASAPSPTAPPCHTTESLAPTLDSRHWLRPHWPSTLLAHGPSCFFPRLFLLGFQAPSVILTSLHPHLLCLPSPSLGKRHFRKLPSPPALIPALEQLTPGPASYP